VGSPTGAHFCNLPATGIRFNDEGGSAGRRPIIGGRLIITLLRLIIPLLSRLIVPLLLGLIISRLLWLIRGLRPPVNFSGYATPGSPEQSADTRPLPGIVVIDRGPDAGP
jgi:hypothetical protein